MALVQRKKNSAISLLGKKEIQQQLVKAAMPVALMAAKAVVPYAKNTINSAWNQLVSSWVKQDSSITIAGKPGTSAGVANTRIIGRNQPAFISGAGTVTVLHRELVTTINNSAAFVVNGGNPFTGQWRANPASGLFTWLNPIASNFDEYRVDKLCFHYVPSCATTETGRVALYFDKDSSDTGPDDRYQLASYQYGSESAPWYENAMEIPGDNKFRLINDNSTFDIKLVDFGKFGFATYGGGGTNVVGDVYVMYAITLRNPQPSFPLVGGYSGTGGSFNNINGPSYATIALTATTIGITFSVAGTYLINLGAVSTASTIATGGDVTTVGAQKLVTSGSYTYFMGVVRSTGAYSSGTTSVLFTLTGLGVWNLNIIRVTAPYAYL